MKTWDNTIRSGMSVDFAVVRCDGCRCLVPIHWDDAHEADYCDECKLLCCSRCGIFCGPMLPGFTPPAVNYCGDCEDAMETLFVDADDYAVSRI